MGLRNVGPGKVHINFVTYYVDKRPVASIDAAIEATKLDRDRLHPIDLRDEWMGPGETIAIFKYFARNADQQRAAEFIEEHLTVAVDYCTVGDRCETKCSERGQCGAETRKP